VAYRARESTKKHKTSEKHVTEHHKIDIEQNKPARIELLRAQRRFYGRAKMWQNLFSGLALLLPALGIYFSTTSPEVRPFLGLGSIVILLLEVEVISRLQRENSKRGAKVQEQFDTEVLGLEWNKLVAGSRVDPEDIRAITTGSLSEAERLRLLNWYEPPIATLPLSFGRLICQRTNLTYDSRVRTRYANFLLCFAIFMAVGLIGFALWKKLPMDDAILNLFLPALPLAAFVLREHRKQRDTVESLTTLKSEVEKLWDKATGGASSETLTTDSRALQDAIYRHRASNPLVYDWLYDLLRDRDEDLTRHATEKLVAQAQAALKTRETK